MKTPFLSVITVVRNDRHGFDKTRCSLESQSCRDFEWVVVDGASTDGTTDRIIENKHLISAWTSEPDAGIYDAMNKGVRLCSGDYVVFLNAGDSFAHSDVVVHVASFLCSSARRQDVLCGGANLVFSDGRSTYRPPRCAVDYIWHGLPANHQATYYRRSLLIDHPFDLRFRICGDYFIAASLYKDGSTFGYLDRALVDFYLDGVSFQWRRNLFLEPYIIQRDILSISMGRRLLSLAKRVLSNFSMHLLAAPLLGKAAARMLPIVFRSGTSLSTE